MRACASTRFPRIRQKQQSASNRSSTIRSCHPSLGLILFVPFACLPALYRRPASLLVCVLLFLQTGRSTTAVTACQHVDPTMYSVRNLLATPKQKQPAPSRPYAVVVICVILQHFCVVCVSTTLIQLPKSKLKRRGVGVCLLYYFTWPLIQAVWPRSALALCVRLLHFVRSSVVFHSVCDAVVFFGLLLRAASASCQVILLFLSYHYFGNQ